MKKIFTYILLFFPVIIFAQTKGVYEIGLPLVRNFSPFEYKAFSQNWGFVQDKRGVLYFANGDGVLEYDGVQWHVIPITNDYMVSSLAIDSSDRVYVGSTGEFGYLAPTKNGVLKYVSLLDKFDKNDKNFDYIFNIRITSSGLYFVSDEKLYKWDGKKIHTWHIKKSSNCYKYGNRILLWQKGVGLKYLKNDTITKINNGEFFSNISINNILPYSNKKMLIVSKDSGLYIMSNPFTLSNHDYPVVYKFYNQADYFIKHNQLLNCARLKNGYYAFATLFGGTVIMDRDGNLAQVLDKKAGIQNETHNAVGEDQQNAIWLSLDNGIARVDASSPISFWNDDKGLKGSVMSITRFNGGLFVGTWQGVFYHDYSPGKYSISEEGLNTDISQFKLLKGIRSTSWDLLVVKNEKNALKNKLLVATSSGVYEVENYTAKQLTKSKAIKIYHYQKDPSKIFIAAEDGLLCLSVKYSGDEILFEIEDSIKGLNDKIISIVEDGSGKMWISTQFSGIYLLEFNKWTGNRISLPLKEKQTYTLTQFEEAASGLPSISPSIYKIQNEIYFLLEEGVYKPVEVKQNGKNPSVKFRKVISSALKFYNKGIFINMLSEDSMGNLWIQFTDNNYKTKSIAKAAIQKNGIYQVSLIPFKPIPQVEIYSIYAENNGITWFGGDDGMVRYDGTSKYKYNVNFNTLIRKVILERDSVLFGGTFYTVFNDSGEYSGLSINQTEELKPQVAFNYNSITFEFTATTFFNEKSRMFKVFLEGFDKKWSDWTLETKKEYTNLPPGSYIFHVKAKNIFDTESPETTYEFEILPPWYRTWFAYFIYIVGFVLFIRMVLKYSNKRLKDAKLKLEELVNERTNEINSQKNELEKEKEKSDKLLLNILPFRIAKELKENGNAKTKYFEMATVLFSDFKDFTIIAQQLEPQELIAELNRSFVFFDNVCVRHNIEKIKTVGDSYMCAGGVPIKNKTNPVDVVLAAFEMRDFIARLKKEQSAKGRTLWKIRIGVHSGEIISGVVGKKKFAYDIWGDTVNTASRLEQTSLPNKINISGVTYEHVKDFFECTYRGKIPVKHKGEIDMYFAERIKPELSVDDEGRVPNQKFWDLYEQLTV
ncbi:MAG TPA: adenylate/guanylate cyclase domain-containing protein [Bacteroidales bacterium]|nr:adenylate/guanylate cyclase domain-containing protein [Bacteroidales bacterium]HPS17763.1 adenylate/guanylate cyclase domain-containing protein [Bacteroidales bacterium]